MLLTYHTHVVSPLPSQMNYSVVSWTDTSIKPEAKMCHVIYMYVLCCLSDDNWSIDRTLSGLNQFDLRRISDKDYVMDKDGMDGDLLQWVHSSVKFCYTL